MSVFEAIVLGILQGFGEFLPISSSGHLAVAPWLFGWQSPGLAFDVSLHVGTLAAVLWYFRAEWMSLIRAAWSIVRTRRVAGDAERRVIFLIIATIPGAIAGLLLEDLAETAFRAPWLIATTLIVMGIVLWAVDRSARRDRAMGDMRWTDALLIGLAQMLAIVPGVSRSGATMTAGRGLGLTREHAASFSFLMSMPIIAAAAVLKFPEALAQHGLSVAFVSGIVASAISGWAAIAILLRFIARRGFGVFAVYRLVVGLTILAVYVIRG